MQFSMYYSDSCLIAPVEFPFGNSYVAIVQFRFLKSCPSTSLFKLHIRQSAEDRTD